MALKPDYCDNTSDSDTIWRVMFQIMISMTLTWRRCGTSHPASINCAAQQSSHATNCVSCTGASNKWVIRPIFLSVFLRPSLRPSVRPSVRPSLLPSLPPPSLLPPSPPLPSLPSDLLPSDLLPSPPLPSLPFLPSPPLPSPPLPSPPLPSLSISHSLGFVDYIPKRP